MNQIAFPQTFYCPKDASRPVSRRENCPFDGVVVLGLSMAGKLAALALDDEYDVKLIAGPKLPPLDNDVSALAGKLAQTHTFLPRFVEDIKAIVPELFPTLAATGIEFQQASRVFWGHAPLSGKRLKATRWQVESVVDAMFQSRFAEREKSGRLLSADMGRTIDGLHFGDSSVEGVDPRTLVVDAMGSASPLISQIATDAGLTCEDAPIGVGYTSQMFRLRSGKREAMLPDPELDCGAHLGRATLSLLPGSDGWFSVTLIWDSRDKATRRLLSDPQGFLSVACQAPGAEHWIRAAERHGRPTQFINPRNRWFVPLVGGKDCPQNYVAIGDALVTTSPSLGAGCSWLTSHIRILMSALQSGQDWARTFRDCVTCEQRAFFEKSLDSGPPLIFYPPPDLPRMSGNPITLWANALRDRRRAKEVRDAILERSTLS